MFQRSLIGLVAAIGVMSMLVGTAYAVFTETFESGYAGNTDLVGQNSWTSSVHHSHYASVDEETINGSGYLGGWGVDFVGPTAQPGASKVHGVSSISSDTLEVSADAFFSGTAYPLLVASDAGPTSNNFFYGEIGPNYLQLRYKDTTVGELVSGATGDADLVGGEWYNIQLKFNHDAPSVTMDVYKYSTASIVASRSIALAGLAPFVERTHVSLVGYVGSGSALRFDNILVDVTPIPEPASVGLLSLGVLLMGSSGRLNRFRRKRA